MGGSGGGSSGKIEYPDYMESAHETWLAAVYSDISVTSPYTSLSAPSTSYITRHELTGSSSAVDDFKTYLDARKAFINDSLTSGATVSPKADALATEIDAAITALTSSDILSPVAYLEDQINELDITSFVTIMDAHISALSSISFTNELDDHITALNNVDDLDEAVELETVLYPRFEAGMRDINAVQSSAYVVGKALMESDYASRMVKAKYEMLGNARAQRSQLYQGYYQALQQAREAVANIMLGYGKVTFIDKQALLNDLWKLRAMLAPVIDQGYATNRELLAGLDPLYDSLYTKAIEVGRMSTIAEMEKTAMDADFDDKSGRWKLENWQTACNVMGSIAGGTAVSAGGKTNKAQSALAGGLAGAAAGAYIGAKYGSVGGPWGAAIGAVVGIGASLLS